MLYNYSKESIAFVLHLFTQLTQSTGVLLPEINHFHTFDFACLTGKLIPENFATSQTNMCLCQMSE